MSAFSLAYLDIPIGVSGDMLLGALVDAGLELAILQAALDALPIPGVHVEAAQVRKRGIAATQVTIRAPRQNQHRHLADIQAILQRSALPEAVQRQSLAVFRRLAQAEARVHGVQPEEVHFHEVGALDAIADVVGVVAGVQALGIEMLYASPLPLSHGQVHTEHGLLPVPPPAVLALLEGVPVRGIDVEGETVTPTGAALVTTLAAGFGPPPPMQLARVAHGAGAREFPLPNIVRLLLGRATAVGAATGAREETLVLLATNVDDMNPEWLAPLLEDLLAKGALDAWLVPLSMKKGRPGFEINVLSPVTAVDSLKAHIFAHTSTLGIRQLAVVRHALPRRQEVVETTYGTIRIKVAEYAAGRYRAAPEYEDCRAAARAHNVSLAEVYAAALAAWRDRG
ncbi:MAG: nickel pincer cofactor biosynthesis protein LarC [Caldilineae bacterium]|nr:MAG: nickel pincer cofactor biosynthesis protein LarC [Caldilineae bacterium]